MRRGPGNGPLPSHWHLAMLYVIPTTEELDMQTTKLDGPSVAEMAKDGNLLDHVTDAELDAGIQAAEHWLANAERVNRRSDARAYRQIVGELWAEYRRRLSWQAANDGTGPRMWFVYRETATGTEYLESAHGRIIRFATCDAARRRAFALNGKPAPTPLGV